MKMTYAVTVGSSSTVIVPDANKHANPWAIGPIPAGWYALGDNGQLYWSTTAGTTTSLQPTHTRGVETVGAVDWLAVTGARDIVISADEDNAIWLAKDGDATKNEGTKLDGVKARAYGDYSGKITGIADSGDATITVEL